MSAPRSLGSLRPLRARTASASLLPLYLIHPMPGYADPYTPFAEQLPPDRSIVGVEATGAIANDWFDAETTVEALARAYLALIDAHTPGGRYLLAGWSLGGVVAYEMARQLEAANKPAPRWVALFDTVAPSASLRAPEKLGNLDPAKTASVFLQDACLRDGRSKPLNLPSFTGMSTAEILSCVRDWSHAHELFPHETELERWRQRLGRFRACAHALAHHVPNPLRGPLVFFRAMDIHRDHVLPADMGWERTASRAIEYRPVGGGHYTLFRPEYAKALAASVAASLADVDS